MNADRPWALELTGERTVPGVDRENYWFRRHEAAYLWVSREFRPSAGEAPYVLEAGSGEGYGADLLRRAFGGPVVALDYDDAACTHAHCAYPGVSIVRCNLAALPVRPDVAALAVSMQVIEHLWNVAGFLDGVRSALRPGGVAVVSTPNRLSFSPGLERGERPTNPFHVEEFDRAQVVELLVAAGFADVSVVGLSAGERLAADERSSGSIVGAQVAAIVNDAWTDQLDARVRLVTAHDFVVGPAHDDCLDLIGVGVRV